jgi:hypothetical protein
MGMGAGAGVGVGLGLRETTTSASIVARITSSRKLAYHSSSRPQSDFSSTWDLGLGRAGEEAPMMGARFGFGGGRGWGHCGWGGQVTLVG